MTLLVYCPYLSWFQMFVFCCPRGFFFNCRPLVFTGLHLSKAMKFSFCWPVNSSEHYILIIKGASACVLAPSGVLYVPASQVIAFVAVLLPLTEMTATSISPHSTAWKKVSSCILPTQEVSLDSLGIKLFCHSDSDFIFGVELTFNNGIFV